MPELSGRFRVLVDVVLTLTVLTFAVLSYGDIVNLPLTGTDALPTIVAARVESISELFAVIGRELRGGIDFSISYYRPLTLLTYSIDYLVWGLSAKGYHVTNLLLHGLATVSVFWMARLAFGLSLGWAAMAAVIFILHPVTLEVVPAVTRRQEPLMVIGLAIALIGARYIPLRRGWVLTIIGSLVAVTSVERGFVVPAVVFAYHFAFASDAGNIWERGRRALRFSSPILAISLGMYILRYVLFGGSGIYFQISNLVAIPLEATVRLIYPQEFLLSLKYPESLADVVVVSVAVVAAIWFISLALQAKEQAILVYAAISTGAYFLFLGLAGQHHPWYVYSAVPALALSICAFTFEGFRLLRQRTANLSGLAYLAFGAVLFCLVAFPSPVFRDYPAWRVAAELSEKVTAGLQSLAQGLPDEVTIVVINIPIWFTESSSDKFVTRSASVYLPRSLQVWADTRQIENKIFMLGGARYVTSPSTPKIDFGKAGSVRIYFQDGAADYLSSGHIGAQPVSPSLGRGYEFPWPPQELAGLPYKVFVFDGHTFLAYGE